MLDTLRLCGYDLPPTETDLSVFSNEQLLQKICDFWDKCNKCDDIGASEEFLELLVNYPASMCKREVSEELKNLMALFYFWYPPKLNFPGDPRRTELMAKLSDRIGQEHLYSYEHLALIFLRSKATIHEAVKEKEEEVKALIQQVNLRKTAQQIALQELIEEEKAKLTAKKQNSIKESTK